MVRTCIDAVRGTKDAHDLGMARGFISALEYLEGLPGKMVEEFERREINEVTTEAAGRVPSRLQKIVGLSRDLMGVRQ